MAVLSPPSHTQILVIGGGPSGSYAASALVREGFKVVLLEASAFPRYHIGESLIPSIPHLLRFIDAENKIRSHGFIPKPGAAMKFVQHKKEGYTDFLALGPHNHAWNVIRSEFDMILLEHAMSCGVEVFQSTKVTSLEFGTDSPDPDPEIHRPVSATWTRNRASLGEDAVTGTITFDYVVDASGRAGMMSTKYLKNRRFNSNLKNIAIWGYWIGVGQYTRGTPPLVAPWFEALTDESGWAWFIPLHNGTTSVGIVMEQKAYNQRAQSRSHPSTLGSQASSASGILVSRYLTALECAPGVLGFIGTGQLVQRPETPGTGAEYEKGSVLTASDFSYSASSYAGKGYRLVGDAGAFIDPWFSSGVHLAMTSALSAAASIAAVIRGDCSETEAANYHSQRVAISYTRFLVVVLSTYKQMRSQATDVLCDIGENNFDKAFALIRPLIQGSADLGPRLSESEVQKALDFCAEMFTTTPEQHAAVRHLMEGLDNKGTSDLARRGAASQPGADELDAGARNSDPRRDEGKAGGVISAAWNWLRGNAITAPRDDDSPSTHPPATALFNVKSPVLSLSVLEDLARRAHRTNDVSAKLDDSEEETRQVLANINARRVIHRDHDGLHSLQEEALEGYCLRLQRGKLGLEKAGMTG